MTEPGGTLSIVMIQSPRAAEEEKDSLQIAGVGGPVSPQVMP